MFITAAGLSKCLPSRLDIITPPDMITYDKQISNTPLLEPENRCWGGGGAESTGSNIDAW